MTTTTTIPTKAELGEMVAYHSDKLDAALTLGIIGVVLGFIALCCAFGALGR